MAKNFIDSDFIKVKYLFRPSEARKAELRRTYDRLMERAKGRVYDSFIYDNHHILPKSLGGSNDITNLAVLTHKEHFLAHWVLTRITTGSDQVSMLFALNRMSQGSKNNRNRIISGWQYALARLARVEAARRMMVDRFAKPGAREAQSKALFDYFSKPGSCENHSRIMKIVRNTDEARETHRQASLRHYEKPGAREAHKAAHNTDTALKNYSESKRRYYAQPGAREAHKAAHREKTGRCVENTTLNIRFGSISEAAEYFGLNATSIGNCCAGRYKSSGGYAWRYITKDEYDARKPTDQPTCKNTRFAF